MVFCCSDCFNPKRDRFHAFIREHGFISDETCPYCKSETGIKIEPGTELFRARVIDLREFKIKIEYFLET